MPELICENSAPDTGLAIPENLTGEWVLVHKGELAGLYDSFEAASSEAAIRFHRRRCLVRPISTIPLTLMVSVESLQAINNKLPMLFEKWIRFFARRLFAANEMSC